MFHLKTDTFSKSLGGFVLCNLTRCFARVSSLWITWKESKMSALPVFWSSSPKYGYNRSVWDYSNFVTGYGRGNRSLGELSNPLDPAAPFCEVLGSSALEPGANSLKQHFQGGEPVFLGGFNSGSPSRAGLGIVLCQSPSLVSAKREVLVLLNCGRWDASVRLLRITAPASVWGKFLPSGSDFHIPEVERGLY